MTYADFEYYSKTYGGTVITAEEADRALQTASETVDALTFCRIVENGLEALTAFQKDVIRRVVCALADWQKENADIIDNPYSSYSINGVSATWGGSAGVLQVGGEMIPSRLYSDLKKTGLCHRGVW